ASNEEPLLARIISGWRHGKWREWPFWLISYHQCIACFRAHFLESPRILVTLVANFHPEAVENAFADCVWQGDRRPLGDRDHRRLDWLRERRGGGIHHGSISSF